MSPDPAAEVNPTSILETADLADSVDARDIPPVDPPTAWDDEADVVIVGGGGAGLCAAAAALRNGATVLVLEKQARTGGHSQHGGAAATFNTRAAQRRKLNASRSAAFKYTYTVQSNGTIDPRLLSTLIDRAHEVYDWSETQSWGQRWDAMTLGFIPDQGVARQIVKGTLRNGAFTSGTELVAQMYPWLQWLANHVAEKGGRILVNTKAEALVKESRRIVGVKAATIDGAPLFVRADKAVILAGAGFTNNRAMLERFCPDAYETAVGSMAPPSDTGEVIRMALGAGADVAGRNAWVAFAGGIPFYDTAYTGKPTPGPWSQYLREGWLQLARGGGWLEVNAACEEYLPDLAHADYELHPKATASQPGRSAYVIFDADYPTTIWQTLPPPMLDDRPMTERDPEYPWFGEFRELAPKNWLDAVRHAIELGGIKSAATIADLATELGLDPGRLTSAVSAWNAKAAAGKPDEFGRLPQNMKPIRTPPLYGLKTGPIVSGTFCGPRVNHRLEVLDTSLEPIPGLYAAGLTAGGTNGEGVVHATILSNLGLAFSSGWIAGDNATASTPTYQPVEMAMESDIREQRLLYAINRRYPRVGAAVMTAAFGVAALRSARRRRRVRRARARARG